MRLGAAALVALLAGAGAAWAHASERAVILTLPTGHYIAGAAAAVALTALAVPLAGRMPGFAAIRLVGPFRPWFGVGAWLGTAGFLAAVVAGWLGERDPFENFLPLVFWTGLWVGLTLASVVCGNLWRLIEPWRAPVRLIRRLLGRTGGVGLTRLGYAPAVAGYLAFAWFEIVSLSPDDPARLAAIALGYWALILLLAVAEGEDWLDRGEFLTVYFGFVARIAPLWAERTGEGTVLRAGWPGAQVLAMPVLPPSGIVFLTLVLASVSFDGLSETFWWLARIGINPLEFPGRSAVVGVNTVGLLGAWALTTVTILAAIAAGLRLAGAGHGDFARLAGRFMLSFLPIAAGYHVAHYLVAFLTNGQYLVVALSDPFGQGWNLIGLPDHWVSFGFLTHEADVRRVWNVQFAAILGAHLIAVLLSFRLTRGLGAAERLIAHLPVTVLMVGYTVLGLWLLSSPTGA